jgi:hypothetical protein
MRSLIIALVLLVATPAFAQDGTAPIKTITTTAIQSQTTVVEADTPIRIPDCPLGDDSLKAVEKPSTQLTKRIFLVLDVSGSMRGVENKIGRVLQTVSAVIQQPIDDAEVAISTFTENAHRWPGIPEPDADKPVPYGWARLPSANALSYAHCWVAMQPQDGSTDPRAAMNMAFDDKREGLSIIIVTDGEFNVGPFLSDDEAFDKFVRAGQERREKNGLGRAPIMVYGVGKDVGNQKHLARVGKEHGGGFWIDKKPIEQKTETKEPD